MYYISICDRQSVFCENLRKYLEDVLKKFDVSCEIKIWNKHEDFVKHLIQKNKVDLLFLEIEISKAYDCEILNKLGNYCMNIIYLSYDKTKVMEFFNISPSDFIVKPVDKDQLEATLKRFIVNKNNNSKFLFKEKYKYTQVDYDSIYYFKSQNHKIMICCNEGKHEFYGKLSMVVKIVPHNFIRIHKSYLVNEYYIKKFNYESIILDNDVELPISKAYRSAIRKYVKYINRNNYK